MKRAIAMRAFAGIAALTAALLTSTSAVAKEQSGTVVFQDHYTTATLQEVRGNRTTVTVSTTFPWPDPYAHVQFTLSDGTGMIVHMGETASLSRKTEIVDAFSAYDHHVIYGEKVDGRCASPVCVGHDYGAYDYGGSSQGYMCTVSIENYTGNSVTVTLFLNDVFYDTIIAPSDPNGTLADYLDSPCPTSAIITSN